MVLIFFFASFNHHFSPVTPKCIKKNWTWHQIPLPDLTFFGIPGTSLVELVQTGPDPHPGPRRVLHRAGLHLAPLGGLSGQQRALARASGAGPPWQPQRENGGRKKMGEVREVILSPSGPKFSRIFFKKRTWQSCLEKLFWDGW